MAPNNNASPSALRQEASLNVELVLNARATIGESPEGLVAHSDFCTLINGMAWNADETRFYLSHSYERRIFSFEYQEGVLGARTNFAYADAQNGIPDGA